jgi:hypothetical protein
MCSNRRCRVADTRRELEVVSRPANSCTSVLSPTLLLTTMQMNSNDCYINTHGGPLLKNTVVATMKTNCKTHRKSTSTNSNTNTVDTDTKYDQY